MKKYLYFITDFSPEIVESILDPGDEHTKVNTMGDLVMFEMDLDESSPTTIGNCIKRKRIDLGRLVYTDEAVILTCYEGKPVAIEVSRKLLEAAGKEER